MILYPAHRGQGQRHPAAARYPGPDRRRVAEDPGNAEGARLSHRPGGAGDAGPAGNADRAATMATAPAVGKCGDLALAQSTEFRRRPDRHVRAPRAVGFDGADGDLLLRPEPFDRTTRHVRGTPLQTPGRRNGCCPSAVPRPACPSRPRACSSCRNCRTRPRRWSRSSGRAPGLRSRLKSGRAGIAAEAVPVSGGNTPRALRGRHGRNRPGHGKQMTASRGTRRGTTVAAHGRPGKAPAHRAPVKHLAQIKKRKV